MKLKLLLIILLILKITLATRGFDFSYFQGTPSVTDLKCLKNDGFDFGFVQAQRSNGEYNPYIKQVFKNLREAGLKYVDVYIFPNVKEDARGQIYKTISKLKEDGVLTDNMVWLDIEKYEWPSSHTTNIKFIEEMIDEVENQYKGGKVAIYSSKYSWDAITGGTTKFKDYQLWYAHYDNNESFSDFEPFGGWTKPNIKQYKDTTSICGTSIDYDYYP
ncbi:lysozyme protein [Anaeramoeba flamelloides]|uniref:Lysozyme protein n=1 Tax=Anaeramoeba flamelloides TaxID=1746091 RepID=A0AAV7ZEY8_9EUKA|nr:lysozyme protein [Anaeramoeba flamelloides]KAJ6255344.1 lysozyme protein [Anaeramoeba flamelloides]